MTGISAPATEGKRRLSQLTADRIVHDILSSHLKPDTLFGLERELIQRYDVSRATLREAIRQVERHGAAHMRRGGGGGLMVADTAEGAAVRTLTTYLEFSDITLAEQFDARIALEGLAARLAAERATEEAVADFRARVQRIKNETDFRRAANLHFDLRVAIANAAGNPALALFITALYRLATDLRPILTGSIDDEAAYLSDQYDHKHTLVEGIISGDAGAAQEIMRAERAYLHGRPVLAPYLGSAICDLVLEAGERLIVSDRGPADAKLGIMTALKLRRDIAAMGWPVGRNLGPERDLYAKYRVSRSVMREAIMLLELHRIVAVRRGKLGGIEVGRPDASYSLETAAYFLRYVRPSENRLREIGQELAVDAAQNLARHATKSDIAALQEHARSIADARDVELNAAFARLKHDILALAGNRAESLVAGVITAYLEQLGGTPIAPGSHARARQLYLGLIDALVKGDAPLAARRVRWIWAAIG